MKNIVKKGIVAILTVVFLTSALPTQNVKASEYNIPSSAKQYNGHYYKVYYKEDGILWKNAEAECEARGGHLLTITSAKEAVFAQKLMTDKLRGYWVGAYSSGNTWKWITGEKASYKPYSGWPQAVSSSGTFPYCYYYKPAGELHNAYSGSKVAFYVCEWDTSTTNILPKQVIITSLKMASSKSANLSWKKVDDAKGYSVYMKKGKNGTYKKVANIKSSKITTYTAKNLSMGQTYYFCVRAYKTILGEKSYGELSKEKKITLIND